MRKQYFEYEVDKYFNNHHRCYGVSVVDCSYEKAVENAEKHRKLTTLLDRVWDEYGKTKKTRHGRECKA